MHCLDCFLTVGFFVPCVTCRIYLVAKLILDLNWLFDECFTNNWHETGLSKVSKGRLNGGGVCVGRRASCGSKVTWLPCGDEMLQVLRCSLPVDECQFCNLLIIQAYLIAFLHHVWSVACDPRPPLATGVGPGLCKVHYEVCLVFNNKLQNLFISNMNNTYNFS